ncbi:putative transcriptional regulatory protein C530.05 [Colletotrichum liriopes]|uniref:Transcriptional regulatory protein C530.05 n=1 Tax=Colletotrichum liriopes TaxID=708192 RepID=A0AA37GZ93_9PEZI|nr:putative transcriptional regulatory protein C530.05 [Colletotrichum liriopes]
MAQTLRYHKPTNCDATHLRTFWTVYFLEKTASFSECTGSLLADEDIGCMVPRAPESMFGDYNWFLSAIRLGRVSSMAYSSLFSVSASLQSGESARRAMDHARRLLEDWRQSVPVAFRPGRGGQPQLHARPVTKLVVLQTQYSYYNVAIALDRLSLHLGQGETPSRERAKHDLMLAARSIAELTRLIDIAPHVSILQVGPLVRPISGTIPLSALFILFDFVIHNPEHPGTEENLALLDVVGGHFGFIDVVSKGALPGSIISEFAGIARRYVASVTQGTAEAGRRTPEHDGANPGDSSPGPGGQHGLDLVQNGGWNHSVTDGDPNDSSRNITSGTPSGFSYLNYPIPNDAHQMDEVRMGELKTLFGWVFPDWSDDALA